MQKTATLFYLWTDFKNRFDEHAVKNSKPCIWFCSKWQFLMSAFRNNSEGNVFCSSKTVAVFEWLFPKNKDGFLPSKISEILLILIKQFESQLFFSFVSCNLEIGHTTVLNPVLI